MRSNRPYPQSDPVTDYLRQSCIPVYAYYLGESHCLMGAAFERNQCEMAYRVESNTLILIIFRQLSRQRSGLGNPFAEIMWFLQAIIDDIPEITHIRGCPGRITSPRRSGLSYQKIIRFYQDILQAKPDKECDWFAADLAPYRVGVFSLRNQYRTLCRIILKKSPNT